MSLQFSAYAVRSASLVLPIDHSVAVVHDHAGLNLSQVKPSRQGAQCSSDIGHTFSFGMPL